MSKQDIPEEYLKSFDVSILVLMDSSCQRAKYSPYSTNIESLLDSETNIIQFSTSKKNKIFTFQRSFLLRFISIYNNNNQLREKYQKLLKIINPKNLSQHNIIFYNSNHCIFLYFLLHLDIDN